jgi:hypothetical protein
MVYQQGDLTKPADVLAACEVCCAPEPCEAQLTSVLC